MDTGILQVGMLQPLRGRALTLIAVLVLAAAGADAAGAQLVPGPPPEGRAPVPAPTAADPLLRALDEAGVPREAIGFRPEGTWLRYPDPRAIPFKNRLFDDLLSDPGQIYPTIALLARAAERFLTPAYSDTAADALFRLAYYTGWDLHVSGFRDYNAALALTPDPADREPLVEAIGGLWRDAGRTFDYYSNEKPSDWPQTREMVRGAVAPLDTALQRIVAQAVLDLADARRWHHQAFRAVDMRDVLELWNVRDLAATQPDGSEFFPQIADVARDLDQASLVSSSRKAVFAAGRLAASLRKWAAAPGRQIARSPKGGALVDLWTPAGRIVISGAGADTHAEREVLLLVDLGGDDIYREPVGASSSPILPVSIAVDVAGDDRYEAADEMTLTQGSGFFGTGVLVDMEGRDSYTAGRCSQGFGFFGTGLLADFAGNDSYRLRTSGQGAGIFGVGLLFERDGRDQYVMDGDGQGFGGVGGIGTLVDLAGNDSYYAEPDARKVPRPDYHSQNLINSSNGQGSGMGRRGDMTDGHAWAGGMGTLLDLAGDDDYLSGNWSAGCGYWYGMGFLYDKSGNDHYRATCFSLAAGAHFCVAALLDDGGNDIYEGVSDSHTGMGFGHDYTVAIQFDRQGDDRYSFGSDGFGQAINMSQVFFVDGGGRDTYLLDAGKSGFGVTNFSADTWPPALEANYHRRSTQVGLFLDLGSADRYLERDPKSGAETPSSTLRDGLILLRPPDPAAAAGGHHFGIFRDTEGDVSATEWFEVGVQ